MKKEENKNFDKVALLGLGKDNLELLKIFDKNKAPLKITICDFRDFDKLPKLKLKNLKINYQLKTHFNQNLHRFDILFRSPGWPLSCPGIKAAKKKNQQIKISSALNFFMETCPSPNLIGITGTKGKGTTATLIYNILKKNSHQRYRTFLGGNIGISPLSFLNKIKPQDWIILELSSFQLEDLNLSPKIAVITNLFKEHLQPADPNNPNYHSSLEKYWQAKLNIARKNNRYLIANIKLKKKLEKSIKNKKIIYFSTTELPSKLMGDYNKENIAAAVAVARLLKIKPEIYQKAISQFKNLNHRLELVAQKGGVNYFDNSFSTTPESTALDLESFSGRIIQIAGGADKGASFEKLAKTIKRKTHLLILLPGNGSEKIKLALKKIKYPGNKIKDAASMAEAVKLAKQEALPQDTVLLSTGCASFGIFKNYKERGDLFQYYVTNEK
ncbi:MAG: UDP-N-acetylmuramoylalanine--D-glutamate ligase [Patescibacteria group bacterium]|nr:UDP-N-acetylmuramoylalanine--D-glutamate ligase [Patescibacteria group bacterium]